MTGDEAEAAEIEILARDLCRCAGDDPDADVIPAGYTLDYTSQGARVLKRLPIVPGWRIFRRQASELYAKGWRKVEVKA